MFSFGHCPNYQTSRYSFKNPSPLQTCLVHQSNGLHFLDLGWPSLSKVFLPIHVKFERKILLASFPSLGFSCPISGELPSGQWVGWRGKGWRGPATVIFPAVLNCPHPPTHLQKRFREFSSHPIYSLLDYLGLCGIRPGMHSLSY